MMIDTDGIMTGRYVQFPVLHVLENFIFLCFTIFITHVLFAIHSNTNTDDIIFPDYFICSKDTS